MFIKDEWEHFQWNVKHSYFFTIYGYSAPVTDIKAIRLMNDVWKKNKSLELAQIDIVDTKARDELEKTWDRFTFSHHYGITQDIFHSYLFNYPRRSCEAFFDATLMCRPREDNPFPKFDTLTELQEWVLPMIKEEDEFEESKTAANRLETI